MPLVDAEQTGAAFAKLLRVASLDSLRALPAQRVLAAAGQPGAPRFRPTLDGYFFTKAPLATYQAGEQAAVPLLVGWNWQEVGYQSVLGEAPLTVENFRAAVRRLYGPHADEILQRYPATTDAEAEEAGNDLATDRFTAYAPWKWADLHGQTSSLLPRPKLCAAAPR